MSAWRAGKVQWWDEKTGQGMIIDEEDGEMYFVHYSTIESEDEVKNLKNSQSVKFKKYENAYSVKVGKLVPLDN